MCIFGFPGSCRLNHCPKIRALIPPIIFTCDRCGGLIHMDELEDDDCYETPDDKRICTTCANDMTVWDALILLGCLVPLK